MITIILLLAILIVLLRINSKLPGKDPVDRAMIRDRLRRENRRTAGMDALDSQEGGKNASL